MAITKIINANVFDGTNENLIASQIVTIEDGLIREIGTGSTGSANETIDAGGRTLMPGMIDLHIHAYGSDVSLSRIDLFGDTYRTAHAVRMLGHALDCGFTTVRDVGGGDWNLWRAIQDGLVRSPRFFYVGKILSMTGGHGDFRQMHESQHMHGYCSCGDANALSVIADGVDECLKAVREELRRGAHCIKIMGSGGVTSPTDPIWMNQYREDEIRAIVNECAERHTYVASHCHPTSAIRRSIECGVRCIEHATLIDAETAAFVADRGAFIVPTMAIIFALVEHGERLGFPRHNQEKVQMVLGQALEGLAHMRDAGVRVGFGTDLLGDTYTARCQEFAHRRKVFTPFEILKQATSVSAEILMQGDRLGCIKPGATADLLLVDGNPLDDISLLEASGKNLPFIMLDGKIVKNAML